MSKKPKLVRISTQTRYKTDTSHLSSYKIILDPIDVAQFTSYWDPPKVVHMCRSDDYKAMFGKAQLEPV